MAAVYATPGVYVEEVPSSVKAIAGAGTSTAGFVGIVPNSITIPAPNPDYDPTKPSTPATTSGRISAVRAVLIFSNVTSNSRNPTG